MYSRYLPRVLVALVLLFAICCSASGPGGGSSNGATVLGGNDPAGDWDCEDPEGVGETAVDVRSMQVTQDGDTLVIEITYAGDIEAYEAATDEKLPVSVQMWFGEEYVEALFESKGNMKVVDGKAGVSYELRGNKIVIRLSGLTLDLLTTIIANSITSGFPNFSGLCYDDLEIDATDPDTHKPPGIIENNNPNGDPNIEVNIQPGAGRRYIMLTDLSPMTSGDAPGSDIDRVEVCKNVNSDCTSANVVAVASSEVVNEAGLGVQGGSDACTDGSYASLGGGYVIVTFTDPSVDIVEGDNIRTFVLSELLCSEAGPDAEQTFDVAVGDSEVVDQFTSIGECGASTPCRLPVPQGI